MRKPLLLAAALAVLPPVAALAQPAPAAPAAAPLDLTEEQRANLELAVARGRALAVIDAAGQVASADARTRVPEASAADLVGWIAQPEGNGVAVTYFEKEGDGYAAVYRSQVLGGRATAPQVFAAGSRPALTGAAARMAAARTAAAALDHQPCGPAFNYLVLPPENDGSVLVYQMSPRMAADKVPGGGYFRASVAADGSVAQSTPLAGACTELALPAAAAGRRPRPLEVNARGSEWPNELHVFLSLWTQRPVVVATGTDQVRLWGVTGEGIAELQQ